MDKRAILLRLWGMKKHKSPKPKAKKPNIAAQLPKSSAKEITRETVWHEAVDGTGLLMPNGENQAPQIKAEDKCPHDPTKGAKQKIIAYTLGFAPTPSRPAPAQREFMDGTSSRFAYRCLPLNIANQFGWELLSPCTFEAIWNGGPETDAIEIDVLDDGWPHPVSHFGHGVLTFHISQLFRTPPGTQLMVTGPMNSPKDGIYAMSGIIETDWSHYTFTMNWVITRPFFPVRFEKGEPFAHIFPVNISALEQLEPAYIPIDNEPDLKAAYDEFHRSRQAFNEELNIPDSQAAKEKWQKGYFRGKGSDKCPMGESVTKAQHWTKLDVKPFPGSGAKKKQYF